MALATLWEPSVQKNRLQKWQEVLRIEEEKNGGWVQRKASCCIFVKAYQAT